jgi:hypothetical protein
MRSVDREVRHSKKKVRGKDERTTFLATVTRAKWDDNIEERAGERGRRYYRLTFCIDYKYLGEHRCCGLQILHT